MHRRGASAAVSHRSAILGSVPPPAASPPAPVLAGDALVARLRGTPGERPPVDPGLAGGLRDWLEDELSGAVAGLPEGAGPVRVSKDAVNGVLVCEAQLVAGRTGRSGPTVPLARGSMVDALFRQWVTVGRIDDPVADALEALEVEGDPDGIVAFVGGLAGDERRALAAEVAGHAERIRAGWPVPPPSWLARTQERMVVPLAGGRVVLSGVVDLALGAPSGGRASVCVVEVKSGRRRVEHRADLHLYALLETLRSGAPPFRVATFYTAGGELDVEPVGRDALLGALHRVVAGTQRLVRLAAGTAPVPTPNPLCGWCPALAGCDPGLARVAETAAAPAEGALACR